MVGQLTRGKREFEEASQGFKSVLETASQDHTDKQETENTCLTAERLQQVSPD
jgi:hypothetical protein